MSLKTRVQEFLKSDKYKQLRSKKKDSVENYNPDKWEQLKSQVSKSTFPDARMSQSVANGTCKPLKHLASHEVNGTRHDCLVYHMGLDAKDFTLQCSYTFCPACNKTLDKKVLIFNDYENLVHIKHFNVAVISSATDIKVGYSEALEIFDGSVPLNFPQKGGGSR